MGEAAAEDGDRSPIRGKCRLVSRCVDPPSQTAVDGEAGVGELVSELLGRLGSVVAGLACADDTDAPLLVALFQLTEDIEDDRRIMDFFEQPGIFRVALGESPCACFLHEGKFGIEIGVFLPARDH